MVNYTKEQLIMVPLDAYCERMIKKYPEDKEYYKNLKKRYEEFKKWDKENPAPEGYVNCFNPDVDYKQIKIN